MEVERRGRHKVQKAASWREHRAQRHQQVLLARGCGNVVERERCENEVEEPFRQTAQIAVANEFVAADRIPIASALQHFSRNINPQNVEAEISQESRGPSCPAPEVQCSSTAHMLANEDREVSKREEIGIWELELRVRSGSFTISIDVRIGLAHRSLLPAANEMKLSHRSEES